MNCRSKLTYLGMLPLVSCFLPGGLSLPPSPQADTTSVETSDSSVETTTTGGMTAGSSDMVSTTTATAGGTSTTTVETEDLSTTGEAADCTTGCEPGCGNGVVEGSEECDDGNLERRDACSPTCEAARLAFLTSEEFDGNFALGVPGAADAACQDLAIEAGLDGIFRAWIGFASLPGERFNTAFGAAYLRTDGVALVDDGWPELSTGLLEQPLNVDEFGQEISGAYAWTGLIDYKTIGPNCENWTTNISNVTGCIGRADSINDWVSVDLLPCDLQYHLYCLQDEP